MSERFSIVMWWSVENAALVPVRPVYFWMCGECAATMRMAMRRRRFIPCRGCGKVWAPMLTEPQIVYMTDTYQVVDDEQDRSRD